MRKRKSPPLTSSVTSDVKSSVQGKASRQFRERLTRVTSPIKGKDTNAKQWNRWSV